jgi:hypothetical protein
MDAGTQKTYSEETTATLIENYKDLIKKTFEVTDKDLLQEKIDAESDEETEDKYLNAIKKRRVALDEVDIMLEKIVKLESKVNGKDEDAPIVSKNPAKQRAKK